MTATGRATAICAALNAAGAHYIVAGGVACILNGHVRTTTDVDILIESSEDNAARVLAALATQGYGFAKEFSPAELVARPIVVIGDDPRVDIFNVAWSVKYAAAITRAERADVDGVVIPYLHIDDLIASKRTGRLLDAADIEVLEEIKRIRGL